ncbi:MAG: hypothetical protein KY393_07530 [Actinobacteria bacterium]|nr:hypothetical protein [Actinomycetota bacterium]
MSDDNTGALVEAAQPIDLLRRVDALCERRAWEDLVQLALRCRQAVERGKQLWPIAEHIDYRLALQAPAEYAAGVLGPDAGRFAHGPLTEVAASTHAFDELLPYLESPLVIGVVAAERVLRGEDLRERPEVWAEVLELPMVLQSWEPEYQVAVYRESKVHAPAPQIDTKLHPGTPNPGERLDEHDLEGAWMDLVTPWVAASNGRSDVAVVEGTAAAAVAAVGAGEFLIGQVDSAQALSLMGWAAASGGAHGRRRGAAAGRSAAWWATAALCDLPWPPDPDLLGEEIQRLKWYWFEPAGIGAGWNLNLAAEDDVEGWAVAIRAEDRAAEPGE